MNPRPMAPMAPAEANPAEAATSRLMIAEADEQITSVVRRGWTAGPTNLTRPTDLPQLPGYTLLGVLGRGGMGVVYKAIDVELQRVVAVKMLRAGGHCDPAEVERLKTEARTVARLRHPHIVQVYDVGEHDGVPYFAMEYVEGASLAEHLQGRPLAPRAGAELVRLLADAIHVAHQAGVIHRDLKPANILLQTDEVESVNDAATGGRASDPSFILRPSSFLPKITDFGIAKRLESDLTRTATGILMGSPPYMAPEYAAAPAQVSPAVDVYALGAILYELLTGRPPFQGETPFDTLQQVVAQEPVPPSRLQPKLPRDVETICLKCLEKAPARRYADAHELADDLARFVRGDTIRARPVSWPTRSVRWARRRPAVSALSALLVAVTLGGIGLLTGMWLEADRQRERAELEAQARAVALAAAEHSQMEALAREWDARRANHDAVAKAEIADKNFASAVEAVERLLNRVGETKLAHVPHFEHVRKQLLLDALDFYKGFLKEKSNDPLVRKQAADTYVRVGKIQQLLGEQREAVIAFEAGRDLYVELVASLPEIADYHRGLVRCYTNLAISHAQLGEPAATEQAHCKALELARTAEARFSDDLLLQRDLALSCQFAANLLEKTGKLAPSEKLYQEALTRGRDLVRRRPGNHSLVGDLANTHGNLAVLYLVQNRYEEARDCSGEAIRLLKPLAAAEGDGGSPDTRGALANWLNNRALAQCKLGAFAPAESDFTEARGILTRLVAEYPSVPQFKLGLASALDHHALALSDQGQHAAALPLSLEGCRLRRALVNALPDQPEYRAQLAANLGTLGILYHALDRLADAEAVQRDAVTEARHVGLAPTASPFDRQKLAATYNNYGHALLCRQQFAAAEQQFRAGLDVAQALAADFPTVPDYRREQFHLLSNLGMTTLYQRRVPEAEQPFRAALDLYDELPAGVRATVHMRFIRAHALVGLGDVLGHTGRIANGVSCLREAAEIYAALAVEVPGRTEFHFEHARAWQYIGMIHSHARQFAQARAPLEKSLALHVKLCADFPTSVRGQCMLAQNRELLGEACARTKQFAQAGQEFHEARIALRQAMKLGVPSPEEGRKSLCVLITRQARAELAQGRHAEATALAVQLPQTIPNSWHEALNAARLVCASINALQHDQTLDSAARIAKAKAYTALAVALVRDAIGNGYQDAARLRSEADFAPLHDHPEFRALCTGESR